MIFKIPFQMDVIKKLIFLLLFCPLFLWGQESSLPKDTIYVKYENRENTKKWPGKFEDKYNGECGIFFNVVDQNKEGMALFYPYSERSDTINIKKLQRYDFLNLKDINKKRNKWIFDHNRPPRDRNGVFQTYLVEEISEDRMVIYPVIWRNEGVIP